MTVQYSIVSNGEESNVTVFVPGASAPLVAHSSHPNYHRIKELILADEALDAEYLTELFDIGETVAKHFQYLSERVSIAGGHVFFDGDEVDDSLTKQIVRFLNEGVDDWEPLVNFMENVSQNPHPHSREQLYEWLNRHDFTIDFDGNIVAYKGVAWCALEGPKVLREAYFSISSGKAIVNGEEVTGRIPNEIGSIIEMPRQAVHHDPSVGCSTGLHVGTWDYASSFARGAVLQVTVNPRDVVSVPTDCDWAKVRVCRYYVEDVIEQPIQEAYYGDGDEEEYCDCGAPLDECECGNEEDCYDDDYCDCDDCVADREEAVYVAAEQNVPGVSYLTPEEARFDELLEWSKRRRQSFVKRAEKEGWTLINHDEPKLRASWAI